MSIYHVKREPYVKVEARAQEIFLDEKPFQKKGIK